jgi:hypothetical protein
VDIVPVASSIGRLVVVNVVAANNFEIRNALESHDPLLPNMSLPPIHLDFRLTQDFFYSVGGRPSVYVEGKCKQHVKR